MLKDLISKSGLTKDEILLQIKDEFNRGYNYVTTIRQDFANEDKLFRNEKKKKDKLGDFTYYSIYSALMARSYVNAPESKFETTVGNKDVVDKLNKAIDQDFNETDMETLKYFRDSNKFKRGVGIVAKTGWDGYNKRGTFENIDPRLFIPDPDADYVNAKYSFAGFQDDLYKKEIEAMADRESVNFDNLSTSQEYNGSKDLKERDRRKKKLNYDQGTNTHNPSYDVYYHFAYFNGIPAMVLVANERTEIIKVIVYKGITKEEKENPSLIDLPLAFTYWIPDGTPFGMRVPTFTADAQKAKAIMNNLRIDKELAELYPMYLRNTRLLPNTGDIEFGFNKIIDVNPLDNEDIKGALQPLQKDFRSDDSFQIEQSIDRNIASSTSIDKISQGSLPSRRETAQTNNLVQDNVDINLALAEKVEAWGEKQLLRLMLRAYQEHFTDGDIKTVSIKTSYGILGLSLRRKDFLSEQVLSIKITTKTDLTKKNEKEKVALGNAIGMIQTLPITESSKKFLYREYFEKIGLDKEKAERIVDFTPDEIIALDNIALLNQGVYIDVKVEYDPMTHLAVLKSAKPSELVNLYRRGLLDLYKMKQSQELQDGQVEDKQMANNMAAQAGANIANEQKSLTANG